MSSSVVEQAVNVAVADVTRTPALGALAKQAGINAAICAAIVAVSATMGIGMLERMAHSYFSNAVLLLVIGVVSSALAAGGIAAHSFVVFGISGAVLVMLGVVSMFAARRVLAGTGAAEWVKRFSPSFVIYDGGMFLAALASVMMTQAGGVPTAPAVLFEHLSESLWGQ
jgi:hypothetical protein